MTLSTILSAEILSFLLGTSVWLLTYLAVVLSPPRPGT